MDERVARVQARNCADYYGRIMARDASASCTILVARGIAHADSYALGITPEAIADFTEALRQNPNNVLALVWRAEVNRRSEIDSNRQAALADLDRAIQLDPQNGTAYFLRGSVREGRMDHAGAVSDFTQAIRLNPVDADAYWLRGSTLGRRGDHARAVADYREAVRLRPGHSNSLAGLCREAAASGMLLIEGRAACDRALGSNAGFANNILNDRGLISLREGRFHDALRDFEASRRRSNDDSARNRFLQGIAKIRLGRAAEGQADIAWAMGQQSTIAREFAAIGITF